MKKITLVCTLIMLVGLVSCDEESQQRIAEVKTVSERIKDLHKSSEEIKSLEDDAALMRDEEYLLEYEYPVRETESYVVTYRFNNDACFEIKMDTYLNKEIYAKKVMKEVLTDMANNDNFKKTAYKNEGYHWSSSDGGIEVVLKTHNIERGTVNLIISIL